MGRRDGTLVRNAELMYLFVPHIMKHRYDAMNMVTLDIPLEPIQAYIKAQRQQGHIISHMDLLLAAYVRVIAAYPLMNRFVVNRRIYDRNELCVAMVMLRPGDADSTISKVYFRTSDTLEQVHEKIAAFVTGNSAGDAENATDALMEKLLRIPGMMRFGVPFIMWLDRFGWLPKSIIDASPFHASMLLSNLASIRTNHVYHHVYDFGTISTVITMGLPREVPVREKNQIVHQRCLPLGVVLDERICSGHYMAAAFSLLKRCLSNPELLEQEQPLSQENAAAII